MSERRSRRSLLRRGGVAAAVGLGATIAGPTSWPAVRAQRGTQLNLFGRGWHSNTFRPDREDVASPFPLTQRGDQVVSWGALHNASGQRVGHFYGSAQVVYAPLSNNPAATLEHHSFVIGDSSLFGMGTVPARQNRPLEFAIVGGTGRYALSRGSYTMVQRPLELGGDGTAEFVLAIA
jgi:hypothetical protein